MSVPKLFAAIAAVLSITRAADAFASGQGNSVASAVNGYPPNEAWSDTANNSIDEIVQTPPATHWGQPYASLVQPVRCVKGAPCNTDLDLKVCTTDNDCNNQAGACVALSATISTPVTGNPATETPAQKVCAGHSDAALLDRVWTLVASSTSFVDMTTLAKPDDRFIGTLRNAIAYANARANGPITMRFLIGTFPAPFIGDVNPTKLRDALLASTPTANRRVSLFVGKYQVGTFGGWNHSKIVAVDGRVALVGGHNMYTGSYLDATPAHDVSLIVRGGAVAASHQFANTLWSKVCAKWAKSKDKGWSELAIAPSPGDACGSSWTGTATSAGSARVIAVGRLSNPIENQHNPSDEALLRMIDQAKGTLYLSQQNVGLPLPSIPFSSLLSRDERVLQAIADALDRGVHVDIVVADPNGAPKGYEGSKPVDILSAIQPKLTDNGAICNLHIAPIRFNNAASPYGTSKQPGNHAKVVIVDAQLYYVGSQNLYPSDNSELGFIIDDATETNRFINTYWNPLWQASSPGAISGAGCP